MLNGLQGELDGLLKPSSGSESERALLITLAKKTDGVYTAVRALQGGLEIVFDASGTIQASDDYHVLELDRKTGLYERRCDKTEFEGKQYCLLGDGRSFQKVFNIWRRVAQGREDLIPAHMAGFKSAYDSLVDCRFWGNKERFEGTGLIDIIDADLLDESLEAVKIRLELFFKEMPEERSRLEAYLTERIDALGWRIISRDMVAPIAYHALLVEFPREIAESLVKFGPDAFPLDVGQVRSCWPVGQGVYVPGGLGLAGTVDVPCADNLSKDPIIAMFDGHPLINHPFLQNRLVTDDHDGYSKKYTKTTDNQHGTAMASLIALGDLSRPVRASTHIIYSRPVMKPRPWVDDSTWEVMPSDVLTVGKINEAVHRIFSDNNGGVAPTVKVINFSIGDCLQPFNGVMSPLARLLDWLSYQYHVLFIVSTGNYDHALNTGTSFEEFKNLDMPTRDAAILKLLDSEADYRRLISPSESMNALTVGAVFEDGSDFSETQMKILPCSDGMPSPITGLGKGNNNSIKPDIVFPGGRNAITAIGSSDGRLKWDTSRGMPGTLTAYPSEHGAGFGQAYSFGTSNATALVTHEASRCYDVLEELFLSADRELPAKHLSLLIKGMLIHGAEWGALKDKFIKTFGYHNRSEYNDSIDKFIGYGRPDVDRAVRCAENRVTFAGYGELKDGEAHLYDLFLPFDFDRVRITRRLTATLTYFTPIEPTRQKYRSAELWFNIVKDRTKGRQLFDYRVDADYRTALRGTVQHEIFENKHKVDWDDDDVLQLKVNCRLEDGIHKATSVPYALLVTFEIKDNATIDVYGLIAGCLRYRIPYSR